MSETMERVWIRIPTDLKTALEGQAARRNLRFQDVARYALSEYVMNEVIENLVADAPTPVPRQTWEEFKRGKVLVDSPESYDAEPSNA